MMLFQNIKTSLMFWGEFKTPPNHFFCVLQCAKCFCDFSQSQIWRMHTVCQHVLSAITGDQWMRFGVQALPQ
ncbi:hypothetical protein AB205_0076140 [Aquarana catesbeiana]|uniref:Uncharacterized protein n=1 Tax=Aquarana catesbeiana TaxID=8400 RepID=A0A2G9Q805_AQUCT|nr:hypothetical protein AB205_0076140 [Aquarana catesbeiana]